MLGPMAGDSFKNPYAIVDTNRNTALHLASNRGLADVVKLFITTAGFPLDAQNSDGATALHVAGTIEVMKVLIEHVKTNTPDKLDGFVNAPNNKGDTVLDIMVQKNRSNIVEYLLSINAVNANAVNKAGEPVLFSTRSLTVARLLCERKIGAANYELKDHRNDTIMHALAARCTDAKAIEYFISLKNDPTARKQFVNSVADNGLTALLRLSDRRDAQDASSGLNILAALSEVGVIDQANKRTFFQAFQIEAATYLLDAGADVDTQLGNGARALHYAVKNDNLPLVELLLSRGASPDEPDFRGVAPISLAQSGAVVRALCISRSILVDPESGVSPLMKAIEGNSPNLDLIRALCDCGANVNRLDRFGVSPLTNQKVSSAAVALILTESQYKPDFSAETHDRRSLLHREPFISDVEIVTRIVNSGKVSINKPDSKSFRPLHTSVHYYETVQILLKSSPDVNAKEDEGYTALHLASHFGRTRTVQALLDAGASPIESNAKKQSPLYFVRQMSDAKMLCDSAKRCLADEQKYLSWINQPDSDGVTPLLAWIRRTEIDVPLLAFLVGEGGAVNVTARDTSAANRTVSVWQYVDSIDQARVLVNPTVRHFRFADSDTLLHRAPFNESPVLVNQLLALGCDPHEKGAEDTRPLHRVKNAEVCRILISKLSVLQLNSKNSAGQTALIAAVANGYTEIVKQLLDAHADPVAADSAGVTPLMYAVEKLSPANCSSIVRLLLLEYTKRQTDAKTVTEFDIDALGPSNQTALYQAIAKDMTDVVQLLLRQRPQPSVYLATTRPGRPIGQVKSIEMAKLLLEECAINWGAILNERGSNLLCLLPWNRDQAVVRLLLQKGVQINQRDQNGQTAISHVKVDDAAMFHFLLDQGADPCVTSATTNPATPLHIAVQCNDAALAKKMLAKGADPNHKLGKTSTPWQMVKTEEMARVFISSKIKPVIIDDPAPNGETLLFHSAGELSASVSLVQLLIECGGNLNYRRPKDDMPLAFNIDDLAVAELVTNIRYAAMIDLAVTFQGETLLHRGAFVRDEAVVLRIARALKANSVAEFKGKTGTTHPLHLIQGAAVLRHLLTSEFVPSCISIDVLNQNNETPLLVASRSKEPNHELMMMLLTNGADANTSSVDGSVLHYIVIKDQCDTLKALIDKRADVRSRTRNQSTVLHFVRSKTAAVMVLTAAPDLITMTDSDGGTALHMLCQKNPVNVELIEYLCSFPGVNVNRGNRFRQTPLHVALPAAAKILLKYGADVNALDATNQNLFHYSNYRNSNDTDLIDTISKTFTVWNEIPTLGPCDGEHFLHNWSNPALLKIVIPHIDVNARSGELGDSLLGVAARADDLVKVLLLLNRGAKTDIKNELGEQPLHCAFRSERPNTKQIVAELLKSNAPVSVQTKTGNTPLHAAAEWGRLDLMKMLCERKASPNIQRNSDGMTPLHALAAVVKDSNHPELAIRTEQAKYLLSLNPAPDFSLITKRNQTLLHFALYANNARFVETILKQWRESKRMNDLLAVRDAIKNHTPLLEVDDYRLAALMIEHGADMYHKDTKGDTLLHQSVSYERLEWIAMLRTARMNPNELSGKRDAPLHRVRKLEVLTCFLPPLQPQTGDTKADSKDGKSDGTGSGKSDMKAESKSTSTEAGSNKTDTKSEIKPVVSQGRGWVIAPNINLKNASGDTPLHSILQSSASAEFDLIRAMLDRGADPRLPNNAGIPAAFYATDSTVIRLLVGRYPEVLTLKDEKGNTALHHHAPSDSLELMRIFALPQNIEAKNKAGLAPLHLVRQRKAVTLLVQEFKANPLISDDMRNTPMHHAVVRGDYAVVEELAELKASPNVVNVHLMTPFHYAFLSMKKNLHEFLKKYQFDFKLIDATGRKALTKLPLNALVHTPCTAQAQFDRSLQRMVVCLTCSQVEYWGPKVVTKICMSCAQSCHAGHDIQPPTDNSIELGICACGWGLWPRRCTNIKSGTLHCTFSDGIVSQTAFRCLDAKCKMNNSTALCRNCAAECHLGHEIKELGTFRFRCDCGPTDSEPCAISRRPSGILSIRPFNSWNRGLNHAACQCGNSADGSPGSERCMLCQVLLHANCIKATTSGFSLICGECFIDARENQASFFRPFLPYLMACHPSPSKPSGVVVATVPSSLPLLRQSSAPRKHKNHVGYLLALVKSIVVQHDPITNSVVWRMKLHCDICGRAFTFLLRRHHCRFCGRSVCSDHWDSKLKKCLICTVVVDRTLMAPVNRFALVPDVLPGQLPPDPQPDLKCTMCSREFRFWRKQKFCVQCGHAFCADCTKQSAVPDFNISTLCTVCLLCCEYISEKQSKAQHAIVKGDSNQVSNPISVSSGVGTTIRAMPNASEVKQVTNVALPANCRKPTAMNADTSKHNFYLVLQWRKSVCQCNKCTAEFKDMGLTEQQMEGGDQSRQGMLSSSAPKEFGSNAFLEFLKSLKDSAGSGGVSDMLSKVQSSAGSAGSAGSGSTAVVSDSKSAPSKSDSEEDESDSPPQSAQAADLLQHLMRQSIVRGGGGAGIGRGAGRGVNPFAGPLGGALFGGPFGPFGSFGDDES